uniref:Integrase core domain containing protein n=1 Tax=Solanum tuberosum TaxID=4113 RepID=M1DA61_SOLTU
MGIIQSREFQRNADHRESLLRWLARHIVVDGERVEWVQTSSLGIKKAMLSFVAKFFWLLVRNCVSITQADNVVTWDRVVIVAAMVAGLEIDLTRILIAMIHERAFKATTTLPFPCLIFQLCRDAAVPEWHCDRLLQETKTLDIGLIWFHHHPSSPSPKSRDAVGHLASVYEAIDVTVHRRVRGKDGTDDEAEGSEPEFTPVTPVDEVVLTSVFVDNMPPSNSSRAAAKCPRSFNNPEIL